MNEPGRDRDPGSRMPEITAVHFAIFALLFTAGAVLGWIMRGDRCARERIAVNAGWQERVEAQEKEHERLQEQNRNLMQSVNQAQASQKDTSRRTKELRNHSRNAVGRRDDLQRQIKDIRRDLEDALQTTRSPADGYKRPRGTKPGRRRTPSAKKTTRYSS